MAAATLQTGANAQVSVDDYIQASPIWGKAVQRVASDQHWTKYCELNGRQSRNPFKRLLSGGDPPVIPLSAKEIFSITEQIQIGSQNAHRSGGNKLREIGSQTLSILSAIHTAGSAVASLNPYASLAWSLVQCIATAGENYKNAKSLCLENLPRMIELASEYQIFEETYRLDPGAAPKLRENWTTALEDLYTAILQYQVAVVVALYSWWSKTKSLAGAPKSVPQQRLDAVDKAQAELKNLGALVNREIANQQHAQLLQLDQELLSNVRQLGVRLSAIETDTSYTRSVADAFNRNAIIEWISPILHEDAHRNPRVQTYTDTADWLFDSTEYQAWEHPDHKGVFWLQGFMGSGKSCVVHEVVERFLFEQRTQGPTPFAFFYCDKTSPQSREMISSVENILRSFTKQLAASLSSGTLPKRLASLYDEQHSKSQLDEAQCQELILSIIRDASSPAILVLDGLDECSLMIKNSLCSFFRQVLDDARSKVKIFVSSRNDEDEKLFLAELNPLSVDISKFNSGSIDLYIAEEIKLAMRNPKLRIMYEDTRYDIQKRVFAKLQTNAQGMFRWVQMSFAFLHESANGREMSIRLEALSRLNSLFDLYDEMWRNITKDKSESTQNAIDTAIILLMHGSVAGFDDGHGKLTEVVRAASAFALERKLDDPYTINELAALLPGFVVVDKVVWPTYDKQPPKVTRYVMLVEVDAPVLTMPHASVVEYFADRKRFPCYSPPAAFSTLTTLCLSLFLNEKHTQIVQRRQGSTPTIRFVDYATEYWADLIVSLRRCKEFYDVPGAFEAFLESTGSLKDTITQFLLATPTSPAFGTWYDLFAESFKENESPFYYRYHYPTARGISFCSEGEAAAAHYVLCAAEGAGSDDEHLYDSSAPGELPKARLENSVAETLEALVHVGVNIAPRATQCESKFPILGVIKWDQLDEETLGVFTRAGTALHDRIPFYPRQEFPVLTPELIDTTLFDIALHEKAKTSARVLSPYFATDTARRCDLQRWLLLASRAGALDLVQLLLDRGASMLQPCNEDGQIALVEIFSDKWPSSGMVVREHFGGEGLRLVADEADETTKYRIFSEVVGTCREPDLFENMIKYGFTFSATYLEGLQVFQETMSKRLLHGNVPGPYWSANMKCEVLCCLLPAAVSAGFDPNCVLYPPSDLRDREALHGGWTRPLHCLAAKGATEKQIDTCVRLSASVDAEDEKGLRPLQCALMGDGDDSAICYLESRSPRDIWLGCRTFGDDKLTALGYLVKKDFRGNRYDEVFKKWVDQGADVFASCMYTCVFKGGDAGTNEIALEYLENKFPGWREKAKEKSKETH